MGTYMEPSSTEKVPLSPDRWARRQRCSSQLSDLAQIDKSTSYYFHFFLPSLMPKLSKDGIFWGSLCPVELESLKRTLPKLLWCFGISNPVDYLISLLLFVEETKRMRMLWREMVQLDDAMHAGADRVMLHCLSSFLVFFHVSWQGFGPGTALRRLVQSIWLRVVTILSKLGAGFGGAYLGQSSGCVSLGKWQNLYVKTLNKKMAKELFFAVIFVAIFVSYCKWWIWMMMVQGFDMDYW